MYNMPETKEMPYTLRQRAENFSRKSLDKKMMDLKLLSESLQKLLAKSNGKMNTKDETKEKIKNILENLKEFKNLKNIPFFNRNGKLAIAVDEELKDPEATKLFHVIYALVNGELYYFKMNKPHLIHFGNAIDTENKDYEIKRILGIENNNGVFAYIKNGNNENQTIELQKV